MNRALTCSSLAILALTGCPDKGGDSGGDTQCGQYAGPTEVGLDLNACYYPVDPSTSESPSNAVNTACSGGEWIYDIYTLGVPDSATVEITETSNNPWYESQPLEMYGSDAAFYWANFYVDLTIVDKVDDVDEGETTLFGCDLEPQMTWGVYIYEDSSTIDCVAFGDDPGDFSDCRTSWN